MDRNSLQQQQSGRRRPCCTDFRFWVVFLSLAACRKLDGADSVIMVVPPESWAHSRRPTALTWTTTSTPGGSADHYRAVLENAILIVEFARDLEAQGRSGDRRCRRGRADAAASDP